MFDQTNAVKGDIVTTNHLLYRILTIIYLIVIITAFLLYSIIIYLSVALNVCYYVIGKISFPAYFWKTNYIRSVQLGSSLSLSWHC